MAMLRDLVTATAVALLTISCRTAVTQAPRDTSPSPSPGYTDPGTTIFKDDFGDPQMGWQPIENPDATFEYKDGSFRLLIKTPRIHGIALAPPPGPKAQYETPHDQFVSVDAKQVAGAEDEGLFGVACRASDNRNQYYLSISSNGSFGIDKYRENKNTVILANPKGVERSEAIRTGLGAVNRIRAECVGGKGQEPTRLTLYVNGQKVAEATDEDALLNESTGNVGLGIDAGRSPPTDVIFDNFVLGKP